MNLGEMSDEIILATMGTRVRQERLNQNTTQEALALHAGLSRIVIRRLEGGKGCTLRALVKILRALGKLEQLNTFLPDPGLSPILIARAQRRQRTEATGRRGRPRSTKD